METSPRSPPTPLFRLEVRVAPESAELVGAWLVREGSGGAVHDERPHEVRLTCCGEDRRALAETARRVRRRLAAAGLPGAIRIGRARRAVADWQTAWTRDLAVVQVSRTLCIVPTTARNIGTSHGVRVLLEPAMAFGFGEHPTTRMAAREVEKVCRAGARGVLDFGTGSGVLAIAAALAGATHVLGLDTDPGAVAAARANATRNGVRGRCRFSGARLGQVRATFEAVVANVDHATLLELATRLVARVAAGGTLLLTGFLLEDAGQLSREYRGHGLTPLRRRVEDGWVMLRFRRPAKRR